VSEILEEVDVWGKLRLSCGVLRECGCFGELEIAVERGVFNDFNMKRDSLNKKYDTKLEPLQESFIRFFHISNPPFVI
jgi:hypothetical protein